jgi:hypothetical protein
MKMIVIMNHSLMMEAAGTFETLMNFNQITGPASQKREPEISCDLIHSTSSHFCLKRLSTPIYHVSLFPLEFLAKQLCVFINRPVTCAVCSANLTLLDLIAVIVFRKE